MAAIACLIPARAAAQDVLTLEDAVAEVLARNPAVRSVRAGADMARAAIREARAGFLPRVDLIEGWNRGNQPVFVFGSLLSQRRFSAANFDIGALNRPDPLSNHRFALAVEQTVFDGWRARHAYAASGLGADLAELETRRTTLDLRVEAVRAFGRAVKSSAIARSARAAVESAAEDLRRAAGRREAGLETEAQVLALRVAVAEADARRIQAEADEQVARAALNALMGVPLDASRRLADLPAAVPIHVDASALEAAAVTRHPDLQQAVVRERQASLARQEARAAMLPHVVAQAAAESNGESFGSRATTWTAGVQVRWNVFAGGADAARLTGAAAAEARAGAERERVETAVRLGVRSAAAAYAASLAREVSTRQTVEQAVESRRMVRERYDAGLASVLELARAAELVVRAETARIEAVVDVHIAAAALERAAGTLERIR